MVVRKSYLFNNVGIFMHCRELARNEIETDSFFTFARIIIQQKYIIFVCVKKDGLKMFSFTK